MSRVRARLKLVWPAFAMLALGFVLLSSATSRFELECERASNTCQWRSGSFGRMSERTFRVGDVREVRLVEGYGKYKSDSEIVMVFPSGGETRFGRQNHAAAQAHYETARAFFAPSSTVPAYRYVAASSPFYYVAAIGLFAGAIGVGIWGFRKRILDTVPTKYASEPPGEPVPLGDNTKGEDAEAKRWNRKTYLTVGGVVLALLILGPLITMVMTRGQGTLELSAKTRCRFGGGELLPGGSLESSMDPGTYTIEVWTGTGSNWDTRTFTIVEGQTTTFVCQP